MAPQNTIPTHSSSAIPGLHGVPREVAYTPMTHKENLAIKTMEEVAFSLREANMLPLESPISSSVFIIPSQILLQDRMVKTFSRVMARARLEAANGGWTFEAALEELDTAATAAAITTTTTTTTTTTSTPSASRPPPVAADGPGPAVDSTSDEVAEVVKGIQPEDVMTSFEAEEFLRNVETVKVKVNGVIKWYRRYHRVSEPGEVRTGATGAVKAAGGKTPSTWKDEHDEEEERALIADMELGSDGVAVGGWWHPKPYKPPTAPRRAKADRRTGKWAPIPLDLVKNSR